MIKLKRAYDSARPDDGRRFLVERLWPRGVKKDSLHLDAWLRDIAPSTGLRRWFGHDPEKWSEFQRRYFHELDQSTETWEPILKAARRTRITLVYSARDTEHNSAVALKKYLEAKMRKGRRRSGHHSDNGRQSRSPRRAPPHRRARDHYGAERAQTLPRPPRWWP